MKIAPSILTCDFMNLEKEIKEIKELTDIIHLDIMDGNFVPNISFGFPIVSAFKKNTNFILDTHLMISNPEKYIMDFINAGSDIITVHLEASNNIDNIINVIHNNNKQVGLSIKPNTKVEELIPYLNKIDLILIMSVEPGFGGQKFMENSIEKINFLQDYKTKNKCNYLIEVDGGINDKTIKLLNVDIAVVGSYLMNSNDKLSAYNKLME